MSEKMLYLHIGTCKTATTTIQRFCADNREALSRHGICYPDMPFTYVNKSRARNAKFLSGKCFDENGDRDSKTEAERFIRGMEIVHESFGSYDTILLSDESLFRQLYENNCSLLKALHEDSRDHGYEIRLLVYLRRQDQYIESYWNQHIKTYRLSKDMFEFAETYSYLDYYEILHSFEEVVGRDALLVRRYRDLAGGKGAISNFLAEFGLELTDEYVVKHESTNFRLYGNTAVIKKAINRLPGISVAENWFLRESLGVASDISEELYKCSEFSSKERKDFMKKYKEGNKRIAEDFIRDGRPLFSDDYSGPQKRTDDNPEFINDVIRSSAYSDILLYRELQETRKELNELRKRVAKMERTTENLRHPARAALKKIKGKK